MANIQKCTNNGGTTDYYQLDPNWKQAQDIIEARGMNFSQGNILKAAFCFNVARHNGTDYERELRKIIWFAERELAVLEQNRRVLEAALDMQNTQNTQNTTKVGNCENPVPKYSGEFKIGKSGGYVEYHDYTIGSQS